jgi:hypothetical protein
MEKFFFFGGGNEAIEGEEREINHFKSQFCASNFAVNNNN